MSLVLDTINQSIEQAARADQMLADAAYAEKVWDRTALIESAGRMYRREIERLRNLCLQLEAM